MPSVRISNIKKRLRKCTVVGLLLTLTGAYLHFNFIDLLNGALKSQLQIKEGNDFTAAWNKNPFPITLDVFVFTLENPKAFASGAKASLRELGPYSYNLWIHKDIISFNEDQTKVRFWESNTFEFREDSPSQLSDKIRILNFPVYAMANMARNMVAQLPLSFIIAPVASWLVRILFSTHEESLVKELTVEQLLNGYPFTILDTIDTMTKPLTWFGVTLPDTGMPDNKFGFLWTKNNTKGGPFEAYTGQKDTQLLKLITYRGQSTLPFYNESNCNVIKGSEGTTFNVDVDRKKKYYIFTTDTCRTFNLIYQKDTWVNGIPAYRFIPNPNIFRSPDINPDNRCYCHTSTLEMCDGIFDLGPCLNGAPAAYSFPHFLGASMKIRDNVKNMHPDPTKHRAYVDIEPFMGAPIRGSEKLQMNALIKPIPYLSGFNNFREGIIPLIWMRKSAVINDEFTFKMRVATWPLYFITFLIYAMLFGGIIILLGTSYKFYRQRKQELELKSVQSIPSRTSSKEPLTTNDYEARDQITRAQITRDGRYERHHSMKYRRSEPSYRESSRIRTNRRLMSQVEQPIPYYPNDYNVTLTNPNHVSSSTRRVSSHRSRSSHPIVLKRTHSNTTNHSNRKNVNESKYIDIEPSIEEGRESKQEVVSLKKQESVYSMNTDYGEQNERNVPRNISDLDLDNFDSTWTSVNDVIRQQDQEMNEKRKHETNSKTIEDVPTAPANRQTWSPPGAVQ